ncbi:MAG: SLBB domain-containing protein [Steroidobacteraceae bacterium]|nr:SLBB domain-containing protein [Steroidobacteraceae bacterium]
MTQPTTQLSFGSRLIQTATSLLLSLVVASPALAQSRSPSPQAEMFRSLPADQQRAIARELGRGVAGQPRSGASETPQQPPRKPQGASPDGSGADGAEAQIELGPRLRGGDTVVLDIWIRDPEDQDRYSELAAERREERRQATTPSVVQPPASAGAASAGARRTPEERRREARDRERLFDLERSPSQIERLEKFRTRVLDANPLRLDETGALRIPGIAEIPLAGLTEDQATKRLASDPALRDFRVLLTLLPLKPQGLDALERFGYDLFSSQASTFAPVTDLPVPSDYRVGPGDVLEVQLLGGGGGSYSLEVTRSGEVTIPDIGPVAVGGMRFEDVRRTIEAAVSRQLIGMQAVVSMGELRTIQVFIAGEAEQPGAYTVSALSTITSALFSAGGVKEIGSLRKIQLRRGADVVATLDIYNLLLRGDARSDVRLLPGDVILVPPIGATASVVGEVHRPAIYELKSESTVGELLALAGGATAEADPRTASLERIEGNRERVLVNVDLASSAGRGQALRSGDILRIQAVPPTVVNAITVTGHVQRPTMFAYRTGMRVTDVIPGINELRPNADLHYVAIRRESPTDRAVSVVSVDLAAAWRDPASDANLPLRPRDQVLVFDLEGGRDRALQPWLADLRRQAVRGRPAQVVSIEGQVRTPGDYPLEPGMTVADLIRAGGGLGESAYGGEAEITRYELSDADGRRGRTTTVDLARVLDGDPAANIELRPYDFIVVKNLPNWAEQATVTLKGEVRFPGSYPIVRGERLSSVVARAGGFTDMAFVEGSVFTRVELRERERRQLEAFADRLQRDISLASLAAMQRPQGGGSQTAPDALLIGESLLNLLRDSRPVGRLVIDLGSAVKKPLGPQDVVLKDGDEIMVPERAQQVTVLGEVQVGTSHMYDPRIGAEEYVAMSGGATQKADRRRTFIVRANGSVASGRSGWFRHADEVRPGDTIVVPLNAERVPPLPLWTAVTTIIYNLAVATAAVNSF